MVKDGKLNLDFEDPVTKSTVISHGGKVVSEAVLKVLEPAAASASAAPAKPAPASAAASAPAEGRA
jgi:ribosomal protein L12E/L44/L45/RPP1/RPP2